MDSQAPRPDQAAATSHTPAARRQVTISITTRSMWVGALILLALLAAILIVIRASGPITLLVLSIILGEAIRPLVARLRRYRIPGAVAVLLIYLLMLVVVGILLWLLLTPLLSEVSVFTRDLPRFLTQLQNDFHRLEQSLSAQGSVESLLETLSQSLTTFLRDSIPSLLAVPLGLLSGLFTLFIDAVIVLTMTLFWLMSSLRLKSFVVGLFPVHSQAHASLVIGEIGKSFGGYVRGVLISMVVIGLITGLGLTLIGAPFPLLLGVVAGLTALLPYIGPWISGTIAVGLTLIATDPAKALEVVVLFFLVFVVEGEVVQPLVMSRSVNVDPLLVIVSVLIGLSILGIIGAILAVPIAAGIQVMAVRVFAPAVRRGAERAELPSEPTPSSNAASDDGPVSAPEPS